MVFNESSPILFYVDGDLQWSEGETGVVLWSSNFTGYEHVEISLENQDVSAIFSHEEFHPSDITSKSIYSAMNITQTNRTVIGLVNITAKFVGFNVLNVKLLDDKRKIVREGSLNMVVLLKGRKLVQAYEIGLGIIIAIVYLNMGASLDIKVLKQIVVRPIGPAVGLFCQYLCMPLISYSLGLLVFRDNPLYRLGLFASGVSPGGGLSNMWTHLLGGSLDLSIMMTFISTVAALGTVPLWILTLGQTIMDDVEFQIPFLNVVVSSAFLIGPCLLGILIQVKLPKLKKIMRKSVSILSILNILFILTVGVLANLYLFSLLTWQVFAVSFGQSVIGHIFGIVISMITRRKLDETIAISVETAVQNNAFGILLLKLSLGKPAGDLAVVLPASVFLFMPIPLVGGLAVKYIYQNISTVSNNKRDTTDSKENRENKTTPDETALKPLSVIETLALKYKKNNGRNDPRFSQKQRYIDNPTFVATE